MTGLLTLSRRALAAAATAGLVAAGCGGDSPETRPVVFASNAEEGTVSVIDANRLEEIRRIDTTADDPPSEDPQATAFSLLQSEDPNEGQDQNISPNGVTLYVSRGNRGDVAAFDLGTGELAWKTQIPGFRSDHMNISNDGEYLYASDLFENHVRVIDADTGDLLASVPTGMWPHDNRVMPDGERVLNQSIGRISKEIGPVRNALFPDAQVPVPVEFDELPGITQDSVVPPPSATQEQRDDYVHLITVFSADPPFEVLEVIRFDLGGDDVPDDFARGIRPSEVTADGRFLYAQLSDFRGVIEYDLENRELSRAVDLSPDGSPSKVPLSDTRYRDENEFFRSPHHGLALSGDERYICVAGRADDQAFLVERETMTEVASVDVGAEPGWATTGPLGENCYIANSASNDVSVVSFEEQREIARIPVGAGVKHFVAGRVVESAICPGGENTARERVCQPGG